jgi:hypothetical protein
MMRDENGPGILVRVFSMIQAFNVELGRDRPSTWLFHTIHNLPVDLENLSKEDVRTQEATWFTVSQVQVLGMPTESSKAIATSR